MTLSVHGLTAQARLTIAALPGADAVRVVGYIIEYFAEHATAPQRLCKLLDRLGVAQLRQAVLDREPAVASRISAPAA